MTPSLFACSCSFRKDMGLGSRIIRDTDELVARMAVKIGFFVRIKSGDEVKYLLKETKPSPLDGLQDLLQAAVPVWTAQLAIEGAPHIYD